MSFIDTVPPEDATGAVADFYESDSAPGGYLPNYTRAFSLRPDLYAAWKQLNGSIKSGMDLRLYELVSVAAAREVKSSYCMLAHGSVLAKNYMDGAGVSALATDRHSAGLSELDIAVMDLAEKVAADAMAVTQADIERLRDLGLSDADILGVITAAAARCFFSKVLDATGAEPDSRYNDLAPELREALTVGRPIARE